MGAASFLRHECCSCARLVLSAAAGWSVLRGSVCDSVGKMRGGV